MPKEINLVCRTESQSLYVDCVTDTDIPAGTEVHLAGSLREHDTENVLTHGVYLHRCAYPARLYQLLRSYVDAAGADNARTLLDFGFAFEVVRRIWCRCTVLNR